MSALEQKSSQPALYSFTYCTPYDYRAEICDPIITDNPKDIIQAMIDIAFEMFIECYDYFKDYNNYDELYEELTTHIDINNFIYTSVRKEQAYCTDSGCNYETCLTVYDEKYNRLENVSKYFSKDVINEMLSDKIKEYCYTHLPQKLSKIA